MDLCCIDGELVDLETHQPVKRTTGGLSITPLKPVQPIHPDDLAANVARYGRAAAGTYCIAKTGSPDRGSTNTQGAVSRQALTHSSGRQPLALATSTGGSTPTPPAAAAGPFHTVSHARQPVGTEAT